MRRKVTPRPETILREREVLELRKAGATFQAIGQQLGCNDRRAHFLYKRALRRVIVENAEDLRAVEVERLDALLFICWRQAMKGDLKAVDRSLRIAERRAKLLGLDAPTLMDQATIDADLAEAFVAGMRFLGEATRAVYAEAGLSGEVMEREWTQRGPELMSAALDAASRELGNRKG